KIAYDKGAAALSKAITAQNTANSAQTRANEAYSLASGKEPKFTKKDAFNRSFSHVINSTSKILVASAYAVKIAYDKAVEAVGFTNTNKSAIKNNAEQIENFSRVHTYEGTNGTITVARQGNVITVNIISIYPDDLITVVLEEIYRPDKTIRFGGFRGSTQEIGMFYLNTGGAFTISKDISFIDGANFSFIVK
ncbi:MAG: hypothetical protein WBG30_10275, partial [Psychrilyobacter sp.]|uniref:hypothetical protein n=1 Tax=Psychrilyobacter sp. TaxID=2586924 RepID=UPI003C7120EA